MKVLLAPRSVAPRQFSSPVSPVHDIRAFNQGPFLYDADGREAMLAYVYRMAEAKGKIVHAVLEQHHFDYALIFTHDGYGRPWGDEPYANTLTTYWLRKYVNKGIGGINIPGYAFVFGASIPAPFRDHVGLHEQYESQGYRHIEACRVELSAARSNAKFYGEYASFLHGLALKLKRGKDRTVGYFDRALPDFTARHDPNRYSATQYIDLFYRLISEAPLG